MRKSDGLVVRLDDGPIFSRCYGVGGLKFNEYLGGTMWGSLKNNKKAGGLRFYEYSGGAVWGFLKIIKIQKGMGILALKRVGL